MSQQRNKWSTKSNLQELQGSVIGKERKIIFLKKVKGAKIYKYKNYESNKNSRPKEAENNTLLSQLKIII